MFEKLKQFKDLRDQAKKIQDVLGAESVTASSGGVTLTMNGNLEMSAINVPADLLDIAKKEKLEKAIKEAHADALKKVQQVMAMKMKDMGGMPNIPGLTS
jgi:DNA-binding YbaB/EbfC family protein